MSLRDAHFKQRGFALLVFVTLLITAAAAVAVKALNNNSGNSQIARDKITAAALAQAKDALIGRAVADANRPASLPCPDTNNDGIAELFVGNHCPSYIGRLPWRTLGLPDINDASRERLWYVLSDRFRDDNSAEPINSDTKGTLSVYAADGATLLTNQAVAIVFSSGDVLSGQNRSLTNIAGNYLEQLNCPGAGCRNNSVDTGPFITGPVLDANRNLVINDKLAVILAKDIMPVVEKRVARDIKNWLQSYYVANANHYPHPAQYSGCNQNNCPGDNTVCRGRFPRSAATVDLAFSGLPAYFIPNQWYREIYYSVGSGSLQSPVPACGNTLSVSSTTVNAVFFTPGSPIGAINRPSNTLNDYLEDIENQDGWLPGADDAYVIPTATALDRDRLYSLP